MAFGLKDAFNKFAEAGNALNKGANKVMGKEVFGEIRKIEEPREFPPFESFQPYSVPEPEQWVPLNGEARAFSLQGQTLSVAANLDACMQYRVCFKSAAAYYTEKFKFNYQNCVQDFDSLVHYFPDMYIDSLMPMITRAYSILLPFGVFTADINAFLSQHLDVYNSAVTSYEVMSGIEMSKNQAADNLGNTVGGAVQMQGFGFGLKGALKGIAKAEMFNAGLGLVGKYVANQTKMTQEEKATAFAAFKHDVFFQEVYTDYYNTFYTMVNTLVQNSILQGITTKVNTSYDTLFKNLQNPMFPQAQLATALVQLISANPFIPACFDLLKDKFGETEEVTQIINYFAD